MRTSKIALFVLFFTLLSLAGLAQDTSATAKIYFIRQTGYNGAALAFHCFIDGNRVCNLKNKRYSVHEVSAGEHKLDVTVYAKELKKRQNTLTITADSNGTYFIRILPEKSYRFPSSLKMLAVAESMARPILAKCEEETKCLK